MKYDDKPQFPPEGDEVPVLNFKDFFEPKRKWYDWVLDHPGISYLIIFTVLGVLLYLLLYFNPGNWKEWK